MRFRAHAMNAWILLLWLAGCGSGELGGSEEDSSRAASSACPKGQVSVKLDNQQICVEEVRLQGASSDSELLATVATAMVECWDRLERGTARVCSVFDTTRMTGRVTPAALREWVCGSTVFDFPDYDGDSRLMDVARAIFNCGPLPIGIYRINWDKVESIPNLYGDVCLVASAPPSLLDAGHRVRLRACQKVSSLSPAAPPQPTCGVAEICDGIDNDCNGYVDDVAPAALSSDPNNCGRCGQVCPAGTICSGGKCGAPCRLDSECPLGNMQCLGGVCSQRSCNKDNDCHSGYRCFLGTCMRANCGSESSYLCQMRFSHTCFLAACRPTCSTLAACPSGMTCKQGMCFDLCGAGIPDGAIHPVTKETCYGGVWLSL